MARNYNIKWKKEDYLTLRKAVNTFNKQVKKLESAESDVILPDIITYKDLKSNITTRQEYNRIIASLRKFSIPSQQKAIKTEGDIEITKWEFSELKKARKRASSRLSSELSGLTQTLGTGNKRINEIKATIESFNNLEKFNKETFLRKRKVILNQGRSDYLFSKNKTFQENFIKVYKKIGRKEIVKLAQSFKNPNDFWEFISDSNLADLEERYDEDEGLTQFSAQKDDNYFAELERLIIKYIE